MSDNTAPRIVWTSNSIAAPSGYGVQSRLFCTRAAKDGYEVFNYAFYGHSGPPMTWGNVTILPRGVHEYGQDMFIPHNEHYKPAHFITLIDVWVYDTDVLDQMDNLTAWVPIDHDPAPPLVIDRLKHVKYIWSMSRFGEAKIKEAGLTSTYVPHGVETDVFKPVDGLRASARARMGVSDDAFLVVMVAANKGWPSRKNIPEVLAAWAEFIKVHPDAMLYMHTDTRQIYGGIDVAGCAAFYGIPAHNLMFPSTYQLQNNMHGDAAMNAIYNAADVKLLPSAGEGFGIPVIEAQAAGCPVIVTDATAQSELAGPGYKIRVDPDDWQYTLQRSLQVRVKPSRIVSALEWAHDQRGNADLRAKSREFALEYDADKVWREYMKPALEEQRESKSQLEAERAARKAARLEARIQKAEEAAREPQTLSAS